MALASASPARQLDTTAALVSPDSLQPTDRLDTHSILLRLDAERAANVATLEETLDTLDTLQRTLVTAIHRRFVALQKQHRARLCALAQANDAGELVEHHAKSALATFLARLASTFRGLFGAPHTPVVPTPSQEQAKALILVDPATPPRTLDMSGLQERVRAHEDAHKAALEDIYAALDAQFAHVARCVVGGFERRERAARAALGRTIGKCEADEAAIEEDRRRIVALVEAVRSAFDSFGAAGAGALRAHTAA